MADNPIVHDVRPDNDSSLSVVPRMGEGDFETLQGIFKFSVDRSLGEDRAQPGDHYFKLVGLELRSGIAAYIPQVKALDGGPLPNILMCRHWPNIESSGVPTFTPDPAYFPVATGGFTDGNGVLGMPYSGDSVFGPNGGPDSIWPNTDPPGLPRRHSDALKNNGWHGATDHLTVNPIFQEAVKESGGGIEPPPVGGNSLVQLLVGGVEVYRGLLTVSGIGITTLPLVDAPQSGVTTLRESPVYHRNREQLQALASLPKGLAGLDKKERKKLD